MLHSGGKRQSRSQRLGEFGEDRFRIFAREHGLIANKLEHDYGIDFVCQVLLTPSAKVSDIADTVVNAHVRSTASVDVRTTLNRGDATLLLHSKQCTSLVLIVNPEASPQFFFRFLDETLACQLTDFLASDRQDCSVTPAHLLSGDRFREQALLYAENGSHESMMLHLAEVGLQPALPGATLEVTRTTQGAWTVATAIDFYDYFERLTDEQQRQLYEATFGAPQHHNRRLAELATREGIFDGLGDLPQPVVLSGFVRLEPCQLHVKQAGGQVGGCPFVFTGNSDDWGWLHPAGISLTVSKATMVEEQIVHLMRLYVDREMDVAPEDAPELTEFLESVSEGSLIFEENGRELPADYFSGLLEAGCFLRDLSLAKTVPGWPAGLVRLRDVEDESIHDTLAFLAAIVDGAARPFSFVLAAGSEAEDIDPDSIPRAEALFDIPVVLGKAPAVIVAYLRAGGQALYDDEGTLIGMRLEELHDVRVEHRPDIDRDHVRPEMILAAGLPSLLLSGPGQGPPTPEHWGLATSVSTSEDT